MLLSITRHVLLAVTVIFVVGIGKAAAQKSETTPPQSNGNSKIFVGQSIERAIELLRGRNIAFGEGPLAIALDEDSSYYTFTLDQNHTFVFLSFSKNNGKVDGIAMVFFPDGERRQKAYRTWVTANELGLHLDGSYSVHFAKPENRKNIPRQKSAARDEPESSFQEDSVEPEEVTETRTGRLVDEGSQVTIEGEYNGRAKFGPSIRIGNEQVYLVADGSVAWPELTGKRVQVSGEIRLAPAISSEDASVAGADARLLLKTTPENLRVVTSCK